jgi:putative pyoverdin transport system ATP-binding/permease protein
MQLLSFLYQLRISKVALLLIMLASVIGGFSNTALLMVIHHALTRYGVADTKSLLAFIGLSLFIPSIGIVSQSLLTWLSERSLYRLRVRLCRQIVSTPLHRLEEIGATTLSTTLTTDVIAIADALTNLPTFITGIFIVVGCLAYLAWISWRPVVVLLGILLLLIVIAQLIQVPGKRLMGRLREGVDVMYDHFRSLTEGVKELKLHQARRESFLKEFTEAAGLIRRYKVKVTIIFAASGGSSGLLLFSALGALIFALPSVIVMKMETVVGYVLTMLYMFGHLSALIRSLSELAYANVCVKKLSSLQLALITGKAEVHSVHKLAAAHNWSRLELVGVTHAYKRESGDKDFVLGPLDLTLSPGELIFVTGGNGSGKTTLAKLLTGLYAPESGEIRLNDRRIDDENREAYRQHFAAIFSDFHLFKKLLGFDFPDLDQQAEYYLKRLQLENKTRVKNGELSTINLSQGQRKRLALLTVFLEDRPIYLFDEWAADQDRFFKEFFYLTLLPELKQRGKTVIVISHDDGYYYLGDRVIRLEYGKLKDDGQVRAHPIKFQAPNR